MRYSAALDGLRAISVLLVLALHCSYGNFPGGFLGVDIFFALSGYLITGNLVSDVHLTGRVQLWAFYIRRVRRLAPALFAALVLAAMLWNSTNSQVSFGSAALPVIFYYANWKEALDGPLALGALAHTWSLSIEEQFYLCWPVIVMVLLSARKRPLLRAGILIAGLVVALAAARFVLHGTGSVLARYESTVARMDELLVGGLCAIFQQSADGKTKLFVARYGQHLAWFAAGLLGWLVCVARVNASWLYRGGFTLIAALAMVIVLHVIHIPNSYLARALSARPLVAIGKRSYGIYVYHLPLFLALEPLRVAHSYSNFFLVSLCRLAITAGIAWASFRWLELPIRAGRSSAVPALATPS
jgi:peptidoglycan/LPS O-acetylase OafA/YrhL